MWRRAIPAVTPAGSRRRSFAAPAIVLSVAGAFVLISGLTSCAMSVRRYRGPRSDHFDGKRFFNPDGPEMRGAGDMLKWRLSAEPGPWEDHTGAPPGPPPPRRVPVGAMRVTFVGHATLLVQMDGVNILTDPIWSDRASPVSWAGPWRRRSPGIRFEDLPPIDAVVLSHNHYDHLDLPTLERLAREHHPQIFAGLGNHAFLASRGVTGAQDLDWWQSAELPGGVRVTATPCRHFSSRSGVDHNRALWAAFAIEGPSGRAYFAGDTGYGPHFAETGERLGPFRLAMLPIGAYQPEWFMSPVHLSPAGAVQAHKDLRATTSVAMHFGTFRLADDGETEAPTELERALASAGAPRPRFWVLGFGEGRDVPGADEAGVRAQGSGVSPEE